MERVSIEILSHIIILYTIINSTSVYYSVLLLETSTNTTHLLQKRTNTTHTTTTHHTRIEVNLVTCYRGETPRTPPCLRRPSGGPRGARLITSAPSQPASKIHFKSLMDVCSICSFLQKVCNKQYFCTFLVLYDSTTTIYHILYHTYSIIYYSIYYRPYRTVRTVRTVYNNYKLITYYEIKR